MTGSCPDPEVIAAFCDRTLGAAERSRWEEHFADCARCQHVLAVMTRLDDELPRPQPVPTPAPEWRLRWSWTWLAPAAAVVVAGLLWTVIRPTLVAPVVQAPAATFADRELAAPPPAESAETDARKDRTAPVQIEALARRASATAPQAAPAASQAPVAADEAVKAEERLAQAVAADKVGAANVEPGVSAAAARPTEAARVAERAAPPERFEARAQVAEAKGAAAQVVPTGASASAPIIASPDAATMWRLGPSGYRRSLHRSRSVLAAAGYRRARGTCRGLLAGTCNLLACRAAGHGRPHA